MSTAAPDRTAREWRKGVVAVAVWFAIAGVPAFFVSERAVSDSPAAAQFTSFSSIHIAVAERRRGKDPDRWERAAPSGENGCPMPND
jgi:MFS-type transporter involved in bile tolerance (Atg22 family)